MKNIANSTSIHHKKINSARACTHSTVQAETIHTDILYPAVLKLYKEFFSNLIEIFVNYYDVEARFAFLPMHALKIKSRVIHKQHKHCLGSKSNLFLLCTKNV